LGKCSSCETPDEWLAGNTEIQVADRDQGQTENNIAQEVSNRWSTWPNGVVKYTIHSSLTLEDTSEILKAFDEYHKKTCIRFEPWQEGDTDFVSIEVDENVCGFANVCKIGGPQVVMFGKDCRNMKTMIHQLGHALCLGHEHQRPDRDSYLNFSSCSNNPKKIRSFRRPMGLYDYNSQMHAQCNSCKGGFPSREGVNICGPDATPGLSVLDSDNINYIYNCQGCHRHRWIPAVALLNEDFVNMHNFGYETQEGNPINTCRALYGSTILSGMYNHSQNTCYIADGDAAFEIEEKFVEVLTFPGGLLGEDCSEYKLVNRRTAPLNSLIRAGNIANDVMYDWTSYPSYSSLSVGNGERVKSIGKWWVLNERHVANTANFAVEKMGTRSSEFEVLSCSFNEMCMIKKIFDSENYVHENY
ncbi:Zinc metalloproteinase nas-1, partial [Orchesella cincta]